MDVMKIFKIAVDEANEARTQDQNGNYQEALKKYLNAIEKIIEAKVRTAPDIDGLATVSEETVHVILWNYHDDIIDAEPNQVTLDIQLPSKAISSVKVTHYRIDKTHSNAYTKWVSMGSPQKPTAEQLAELKRAAELQMLEPMKEYEAIDSKLSLDFEMPRHSVSLIEVRFVK